MKSSRILDKQGVNEMGLISLSLVGGCVVRIGVMLDSFQIAGSIPNVSDTLKMVVTGSSNSSAISFTIRYGTLSGP